MGRNGTLCLRRYSLFQQLSSEQLRRLESRSRLLSIPAQNLVYMPGHEADSVFLVVSGLVKVCHLTADGKELILAFVEPDEVFGELATFEAIRDEYVKTVTASTLVSIPLDELQHLVSKQLDVALRIAKIVALRRQRIERRFKNLFYQPNRERLIHLLLDLAEQFGWVANDGIRFRVKFSHQDLASLIGSTRETVTVILNKLKAEGSVRVGRRRIVLTEPERLANSVHRACPCRRQDGCHGVSTSAAG